MMGSMETCSTVLPAPPLLNSVSPSVQIMGLGQEASPEGREVQRFGQTLRGVGVEKDLEGKSRSGSHTGHAR